MTEKNRLRGKKAKAAGQRFELKVRKDLESKGWIVAKWTNNVELEYFCNKCGKIISFTGFSGCLPICENSCKAPNHLFKWKNRDEIHFGKLIQAKHKFRGPGIPMAIGTGFPDFIIFRHNPTITGGIGEIPRSVFDVISNYQIIGVESKGGDSKHKYLDKIEKEKCKWLLKNKIFSKILVANKKQNGRKIEVKYIEFK